MKKSELRKLIREQIRNYVNGKPTPTLTEPNPCATAQFNNSCWCSSVPNLLARHPEGGMGAVVWEDMGKAWKIATCEQYWNGEMGDGVWSNTFGYANLEECCVGGYGPQSAPRSTNIVGKNTKRR